MCRIISILLLITILSCSFAQTCSADFPPIGFPKSSSPDEERALSAFIATCAVALAISFYMEWRSKEEKKHEIIVWVNNKYTDHNDVIFGKIIIVNKNSPLYADANVNSKITDYTKDELKVIVENSIIDWNNNEVWYKIRIKTVQ